MRMYVISKPQADPLAFCLALSSSNIGITFCFDRAMLRGCEDDAKKFFRWLVALKKSMVLMVAITQDWHELTC
jgi:hypothetical protein